MSKIPNFFIAGAPKCGTTALYEYLKDHPSICMSGLKEPHYFAQDFLSEGYLYPISFDEYMALFKDCGPQTTVYGEASVWYMYSSCAIQKIHDHNPGAKLIIMLRNPVDMARSLHLEQLVNLTETEPDFEKAWRLQEKRKRGENIPGSCPVPLLLLHSELIKYSRWLENIYSVFPKEQVKVIIFEDFVANTKEAYESVLAFLGVPSDGKKSFRKINVAAVPVFQGARTLRFFSLIKGFVDRMVKPAKRALGIPNLGLTARLIRILTREVEKKPLSPEFEREILSEVAEDVEKLERMLNIDLSSWKKPKFS